MKNIFKSTLVAAAVATVCGTAYAGNTDVTTQTYSKEGIAAVTTAQTSNAIGYETKAAYAVGDKVTFTFSSGALDSTNSFPPAINIAADGDMAGMALGLLNEGDDSVTYRVTDVTPTAPGDSTLGQVISLGEVELAAAAIAAGDITVTVTSETSTGDVLDNSSDKDESRTGKLSTVKSQYGSVEVTTELNATIDVAEGRKAFTDASDAVTFEIENPDTSSWVSDVLVDTDATTVMLSADLAGFDLDESIGSITSAAGGVVTYSDEDKQVKVTYAGSEVTTDTITITPPAGDDAVVLTAQSFELSASYTYNTTKTADLGSDDAGEWDLNGAVVNIPYMPYGPNVSQIIYVSNEGSLPGDVSATAFDDKGNFYDLGVIAVANAQTVTKVTHQVGDALLAAGFNGTKASITLTVNAEDKDITVNAAYNVAGNRASVITSQYKNKED